MSKKAAKTKDEQTYDVRDVVLAKIRGYPSWPAMVVDPESVPSTVKKERPTSKKTLFYCVKFFPAGDYSWVLGKDLSKLKKHEIESYIAEPHKKSGDLLTGYRIALDPEKWERELEERQADIDEAEADAEVDELAEEGEGDDDDDKPSKPKKRKRDSEPVAKIKPKVKKEKSTEPAPKKKKAPPAEKGDKSAKAKKNGTKSKAMVESEDEGDRAGADDAGPSKASPPPAKRVKRDKDGDEVDPELDNDPEAMKVKDWRHKLQRGFLSKGPPKEEDVAQFDAIFSTVEDFDMNIKYLQFSKIGKVMRHIAALETDKLPRDAEYKFKDRAQALVNKWHQTISTNKPNGTNGTAEEPTSKGTAKHDAPADMEVDKAEVGAEPEKANDVDMNAGEQVAPVPAADAEGNIIMAEA